MDLDGVGARPPVGGVQFAGTPLRFVVYTQPHRLERSLLTNAHMPCRGAWSDAAVAERAVSRCLDHFGREIYSWLRYPDGNSFIRDYTVDFPIGVALDRKQITDARATSGSPQPVATQTFRLILRPSPRPPGFDIATAEPLPPLPLAGASAPTLEQSEADPRLGHAIARHVTPGLDDAIRRLDAEPDIPAAGSFTDLQTAQSAVATMVENFGREIAGWLTNSGDSMAFTREFVFDHPVGWCLDRKELDDARDEGRVPVATVARGARLLLSKSDRFPEGFFVKTAYPLVV